MDEELTIRFSLDEEQPINAKFSIEDEECFDCQFKIDAVTFDYEVLDKKPQINGVTLIGNKTGEELGLASGQSIVDLENKVNVEIQAREIADTTLNNKIDEVKTSLDNDIEQVNQSIANETLERINADITLQYNINTLDNKVDGINANLTQQIEETQQDVNDKYNELIKDIDDLTDVVEEDYSTLDNKIDTTANAINQRITDVADELNQTIEENVVALQQEDTALQNQINTHSQTLTGLDTRITNNTNVITQEIADRQSGDNTLQEQVNDNASLIKTKQDIITDLSTIRSNAQAGYNIIPQVESNTQRIEDLTVARFPNVVIVGTPHIEGGQVSNYSATNYLQFPFVDISRGLPFDIYFSFTTSTDITTQQNILDARFGIALAIQNSKGIMALSSNGTSWDIGSVTGANILQPNTTYYVKYSWTGTEYNASLSLDNQTYIPDMILQSDKSPYKTTIFIGGSPNLFGPNTAHPFKGTINFNNSKVVVNGITVWEGMADVGLATRANVSLSNLDEVGENRFLEKQNITDNALVTLDKTVVGAVNELDAKIKDIQLFKFPDATIIGTPIINNGQVSGFSSNNYLILPFAFDTKDRAFEINMAFTTGSNVNTAQNLLGGNYCVALLIQNGNLIFRASSNGTSWNIVDITTTLNLQPSTNYFVRIEFNKLNYKVLYSTNGEDYTQIGYQVSTLAPRHGQVFIGVGNNQFNPFLGIINLNKCNIKLNTSIIWQGMDDAGLATRADISLSNLDELGQAKFEAKQDKLTAGTGIDITNNVISNTQTSAEWGNIQGTLSNQTDLQTALDAKQVKATYIASTKTLNLDGGV